MPRWNQDASADAAAEAFRHRLSIRTGTPEVVEPLLGLPGAEDAQGDDGATIGASPRIRIRTSRKVAILVGLLSAVALCWFAWQAAGDQPTSEPLQQSTAPRESAKESPTPAGVLVHVAGAVLKPGVVTLPAGSRVFQAIEAAGGATPLARLDGLNLAETVADGTRILVPAAGGPSGDGAPSGSGAGGASGTPTAAGKVNINKASVEELGTLPRVGPVMAKRIVDWRVEHGPFGSVEELDAVEGIGPKLMESLQNLVTVHDG
ncbi:ComEA family DNA-binding protein [Paenarthrobacter sp. S56]|uniref:ComEA family DNA-binding protein n=1 Tax=Paenarthrobacter sp. S56 TaxID=3138179 RepID=UPI003219B112